MKLTVLLASAVAASILLPSLAFAGDPIPGVWVGAGKNPGAPAAMWIQTCKDGGGTAIPVSGGLSYCASAAAVATCKNNGGTVETNDGKTVCNIKSPRDVPTTK